MGILDDAIREHLELKRQHGAERSDIERLEQEAFGPATRPGDPEFDTGAEAAVPAAPAAEGEQAAVPAEPEGESAPGFTDWMSEEETTVAPAAGPPAVPAAPAEDEAPPAEEPVAPLGSAATPAEQARETHPELGDTADHPAPQQLGPEDEAEPAPDEPSPSSEQPMAEAPPAAAPEPVEADEPPPPEPPERGIFDFDEADLSEDAATEPRSDEQELLPEEPAAATPPVSSPTTDHDLPPAPVERPAEAPAEEGEDGEDLLEETPDFLQDAPEGEDLWFEQGPPKDFDFDD